MYPYQLEELERIKNVTAINYEDLKRLQEILYSQTNIDYNRYLKKNKPEENEKEY